jgi:hypothetical protein
MPDVTDPLILEHVLGGDGGDEPPASGLIRALDPVIRLRALKVLLRFGREAEGRNVRREVDGLAQDVWARLRQQGWRILRKWTQGCGLGLLAWVGLVTERHVLELLRTRQPPVAGPLNRDEEEAACSPGSTGCDLELAPRELLLRVVHALRAELSPRGAAIFELLILQENPVEHVCTVMEMTQEAVFRWRSRIARRARDIAKLLLEEADRPPIT